MRQIQTSLGFMALACLLAMSAAAGGQEHETSHTSLLIGAGFGLGRVHEASGAGEPREPGGSLVDQLGITFSERLAVMVDAGIYHLNNAPTPPTVTARRKTAAAQPASILKTSFVMLSVRYRFFKGFFTRPGVGLGYHAYVRPEGEASGRVSSEGGLAFGTALGYEQRLIGSFSLQLEAVGRRSLGPQTGRRDVLALQTLMMLRL